MTRQIPEAAKRAVLAASATVVNRPNDDPATVVDLLERAIARLPARLLTAVDLVITPRGTWRDTDPGRAALRRVVPGTAARSVVTEIGVLQQSALHMAFAAVADGSARVALVVGGEAKYSADRRGAEPAADGSVSEPDEIVRPTGDIVHPLEIACGVVVPVQQYALVESALAQRSGRSLAEQEGHVADLWSAGSALVVGRPDAWRTDALSPEDVVADVVGNPLLASPYRRAVVSSWTVDQAVAILVTSDERARGAGLGDADLVGLVGSALSDHVVPLVARADIAACPAISCGASAIELATGRRVGDANFADLYSCFPSAVQVAARELGRATSRGWTVTGGMATYGGPFNSYALHAVAVMAERLRDEGAGSTGVTTCVSGLLSKAAVALWQCGPCDPVLLDVSDDDERERTALEVVGEHELDASTVRVVAATEVPSRDGTGTQVIEIVEDAGRRRSLRVRSSPT